MTHHTTKTSYAPIALFLYNRIDHTKAVLNSLALNSLAKETNLYIFSDGPKESSQSETTKINAIRAYVKTFQGCKTTTIIERDTNWGLADNITQGITQVLDQHEKIIVLESDTTPTPYFLNYMNDSLDLYEYDERVMHISGYMFPIATDDLPSTFFYKPTSCWGWATYRRSWNLFISDPLEIWNELNKQKLLDEFNIKYGNFSNQLAENILGLRKTWAIKWYSTVFLNNGLSLHPSHSYISNIGNDGSGTNSKKSNQFDVTLEHNYKKVSKVPIIENPVVRARMEAFYYCSKPIKHTILKYLKPFIPRSFIETPFISTFIQLRQKGLL